MASSRIYSRNSTIAVQSENLEEIGMRSTAAISICASNSGYNEFMPGASMKRPVSCNLPFLKIIL
jgi:hypothetical protein